MSINNVSNAITSDKKYDAKVAKEEAKLKEEQNKEALRQKALFGVNFHTSDKFDNYDNAKDLTKAVKEQLKWQKDNAGLSKDAYRTAKKYLKSTDFQQGIQARYDSPERNLVASIVKNAKGDSIGEIKDYVKKQLKAKLDAGDITEQEYKDAKKYAKVGTWAGRFFGKAEKESREMFAIQARRNHLAKTKENGPKFDAELQAKLNLAGITNDKIYEIGDANGGAADATLNYSYKKLQPGERNLVLAAFNKNENGVQFTQKEVNKIMKQAGYYLDPAVSVGKTAEDCAKGAGLVAPFGALQIVNVKNVADATADVIGGSAEALAKQSVKTVVGAFAAGLGGALAAGVSAYNQYTRVEDRAVPTDVPEGVTTYEQYAKYLDDTSAKPRAVVLGKEIAKKYTDDKGNLDIDGLNKALAQAAGTVTATGTPLNRKEQLGLMLDSVDKERPVSRTVTTPTPEICEVELSHRLVDKEVALPTDCYEVKAGDNWSTVVESKYGAYGKDMKAIVAKLKEAYYEEHKEALNAQGITSAKGAFFPAVGDELCVPTDVTVNGKKYTYNAASAEHRGVVSTDYKGATLKATSNPFTEIKSEEKYTAKDCSGNVLKDENGNAVKDVSKTDADKAIQHYKKQNPNKEVTVINK